MIMSKFAKILENLLFIIFRRYLQANLDAGEWLRWAFNRQPDR